MVPREVTAPIRRRSRVIQRRRRIFVRLLITVLVTGVAAFVPGVHWMAFVNVAVDAILTLYVWRLLQWKREEDTAIARSAPALRAVPSVEQMPSALPPSVIAPTPPPTPHAAPAEIGDDVLSIVDRRIG